LRFLNIIIDENDLFSLEVLMATIKERMYFRMKPIYRKESQSGDG
jgi:hypothetical protein